jgi:flavin-dependent dehydrogenase
MMTGWRLTDVCVIGGGPAGSTVAHRLTAFGYDVCLVERHASPQPHIGASLPSTVLPLLEVIGVRDRVEAADFLRPERIVVWWSEARPTVRAQPGPPGLHVDRRAFDRLLLDNAQAGGVRVLQPAQAKRPVQLSDGLWRIPVRHAGDTTEVLCPFVVDASGGGQVLGGRRSRMGAPLIALSAEWHGLDPGGMERRVEAGEQEWFWCAPLGPERWVVAVFTDPERLSAGRTAGVEASYRQLLEGFSLLGQHRSGRIAGPVRVCDASSRYSHEPVGPGFVRIGDAALTLDPLSSQGIQSAISSALQAAIVVNTLLKHPENARAAMAFYRDRQREKARQHARKAAAFYGERAAVCDRPFWRERAGSVEDVQSPVLEEADLEVGCRVRLSRKTTIEEVPVIRKDTVVSSRAIRHEALERPVAFLGEIDLVPLLLQVEPGQTAEAIVWAWSERLPVDQGWKILEWLWHRRIVVPICNSR